MPKHLDPDNNGPTFTDTGWREVDGVMERDETAYFPPGTLPDFDADELETLGYPVQQWTPIKMVAREEMEREYAGARTTGRTLGYPVPCLNDTNGDGDCGRRHCPWCGSDPYPLTREHTGIDFPPLSDLSDEEKRDELGRRHYGPYSNPDRY